MAAATGERLDAHHHVWDLSVRPQDWIPDEKTLLRRDFSFAEFRAGAARSGVSASIVVQTVDDLAETPELLSLAAQEETVAGVVGWLDLESPQVADDLARHLSHAGARKLVGIRDLAQYKEEPQWLARPDVLEALRVVGQHDLAFDLLVVPDQLPAATAAVRACPELVFVLDHLAKPPIASGEVRIWAEQVRALAALPNVACKVSGMVTEADWATWKVADLQPYVDVLLDAFGPQRLMFGSDWPVCLVAASYERVVEAGAALFAGLSSDEQADLWCRTARRWYRLQD